MTASHVRLPSSISARTEPSVLRPAVVPVSTDLRRRTAGAREAAWRHAQATEVHSEEDRMRLVAALLVLATLLLWMLFLQG